VLGAARGIVETIEDWLTALGLSEYASHFAENHIDLSVLRDLTDQDLKEIGIPLGHRRKMLRAMGELDSCASAPGRRSEAERRQLTVMFCDLVGSTALSAQLDPEDMRELIAAYQNACARVIPIYDGFIAQFMGDGVLAYFGYPRAHEDDAERAVRAGLEIISVVGRIETRAGESLKVRVGIATGLVVVGDIISEGAVQIRAVVGDPPNLAARLQALAPPETVIISAATRRLLGDLFELRDLGHHAVKGLAEPVQVWAVQGPSNHETRFQAVRSARLTGFVGREEEIQLLADRQKLAWQGTGQIVLISGESGIGKSRLVASFCERIARKPHTALRYQCSPYHSNSALHPFIVQLERVAGLKPEDSPEQRLDKLEAVLALGTSRVKIVAPLFASLLSIPFGHRYPPLTLSSAQQRRHTLTALLDQLEGLARQRPVLFVFEDVHWADPTSLELLRLAAERISQLPILAIVTFRPEFEPPWGGSAYISSIPMGRLPRHDVENMIEKVAGGRLLPAEMIAHIIAMTDGIPLFVEELTKTVLETGILVEGPGGYRLDGAVPQLAIPATLHDSLMARLDRLAPVREVAQVGATIGREFTYTLLSAVETRSDSALQSALTQLEAAELVFRRGVPPNAVYSFKHALVQEAAYESLLKSKRHLIHRRIAEVLCNRFPAMAETEPEVVAHHFTQAGFVEPAVEWRDKAGTRAFRRSAFVEAIAHLEKALDLAEKLVDAPPQRRLRLRVQLAYGQALIAARGYGAREAVAAIERARELATDIDDADTRFSIHYGLWVGSYARGELKAMREMADILRSEARDQPIGRICGQTCWFEGDFVGARTYFEQALTTCIERDQATIDFRTGHDPVAGSKIYLAIVLWALGELIEARRLADEAIERAVQIRHVTTIANTHAHKWWFEMTCRNLPRAFRHAQTLLSLSREHGLQFFFAYGTFMLGWASWHQGQRESGIAGMREGIALLRSQGINVYRPFMETLLGQAEAEMGRVEAGLAILGEQLTEVERTGQRSMEAEMHRIRGQILLRRQPTDHAAAEAAFIRAIEIARNQQTRSFELRATLALAKLYRATSRGELVPELFALALAYFSKNADLPEIDQANFLLRLTRRERTRAEMRQVADEQRR
jgi:class 3 adenylate cyclase/tetratricopeptide (TPR) repeat protein